MTSAWFTLPGTWALQDVQAGINVVVAVSSSITMYAFVRYSWQTSVQQLAGKRDVPLSILLSINSVGEAMDAALLLKRRLFSMNHIRILLQSLVVVLLTLTALFSGIIARYATRREFVVVRTGVLGSLASRDHDTIMNAQVRWNLTQSSLDQAGFPYDQLLDFLPDTDILWKYVAEEWNSTYSLSCKETPLTPIRLFATGNCSRTRDELPGLFDIVNFDDFDYNKMAWCGFYNNRTMYKDIMLFLTGTSMSGYEEDVDVYRNLKISIVSVQMHNIPRPANTSSDCDFGVGPVEHASFTKVECDVTASKPVVDGKNFAYPDVDGRSLLSITEAYADYYQARYVQESASNSAITVITPRELLRFYQAYLITKDDQYRHPVTRILSTNIRVVQLSVPFLSVYILISILTVFFLCKFAWFAISQPTLMTSTPDSKLDWMRQSIRIAHTTGAIDTSRSDSIINRSDIFSGSQEELSRFPESRRSGVEFEMARYYSSNPKAVQSPTSSSVQSLSNVPLIASNPSWTSSSMQSPISNFNLEGNNLNNDLFYEVNRQHQQPSLYVYDPKRQQRHQYAYQEQQQLFSYSTPTSPPRW